MRNLDVSIHINGTNLLFCSTGMNDKLYDKALVDNFILVTSYFRTDHMSTDSKLKYKMRYLGQFISVPYV